MMQTERIKKMLHILKTKDSDINVNVSIIDYDLEQTCDSEILTLHLKESYNSLSDLEDFLKKTLTELNTSNTNINSYISDFIHVLEEQNIDTKQSSYTIYKDFIIRSRVYYDTSTDQYLSALDGDIVVIDKALPKISILTNLTKLSLIDNYTDIKVQMLDADTLEPIKNQPLSLFFSSSTESIAQATTNKEGIATFHFSLADADIQSKITLGDNFVYVEYKGNRIYRALKTTPILVNIQGLSDDIQSDITSSITAALDTKSKITITYKMSFDRKTLTQSFRDKTTNISISDEDLLKGDVLFYIDDTLVGYADSLKNSSTYSYASITTLLSSEFYNKPINIRAIFQGNNYFTINTASTIKEFNKIKAYDRMLTITQPDTTKSEYNINLSFKIPASCVSTNNFTDAGHIITHLSTGGEAEFYLYNKNGGLGKISDGSAFTKISSFNTTKITGADEDISDYYLVSLTNQSVSVDLAEYQLTLNDILRIQVQYKNSTLIEDFSIEDALFYNIHFVVLKNTTNTPVAGATVSMGNKQATTDQNGNCYFSDMEASNYTVTIEKDGYKTKTTTVYVSHSINDYEISLYTKRNNGG